MCTLLNVQWKNLLQPPPPLKITVWKYGLSFDCYAYLMTHCTWSATPSTPIACVEWVRPWMTNNLLQLHSSKTEVILNTSLQPAYHWYILFGPNQCYFFFCRYSASQNWSLIIISVNNTFKNFVRLLSFIYSQRWSFISPKTQTLPLPERCWEAGPCLCFFQAGLLPYAPWWDSW